MPRRFLCLWFVFMKINSSNQVSVIKIETLFAYVSYSAKVVFVKVGFCFFFAVAKLIWSLCTAIRDFGKWEAFSGQRDSRTSLELETTSPKIGPIRCAISALWSLPLFLSLSLSLSMKFSSHFLLFERVLVPPFDIDCIANAHNF